MGDHYDEPTTRLCIAWVGGQVGWCVYDPETVTEDGDLASFPSLLEAEAFVIAECERREVEADA